MKMGFRLEPNLRISSSDFLTCTSVNSSSSISSSKLETEPLQRGRLGLRIHLRQTRVQGRSRYETAFLCIG